MTDLVLKTIKCFLKVLSAEMVIQRFIAAIIYMICQATLCGTEGNVKFYISMQEASNPPQRW